MFFDQDQEARDAVSQAIRTRSAGVAPVKALHVLAHQVVAEDRHYIRFIDGSRRFVETVAASEALKARSRAIRDEVAASLATELAAAAGQAPDDPTAHLAANLLLATWSVAFIQAHNAYRHEGRQEVAKAIFLAVVDKGSMAIEAAMMNTPYG